MLLLPAGFAGLIAAGTALLALPLASSDGHGAGMLTAFFTSTSAVCVTGLVLVDTADHWSGFGQATILVLIQLGGLGFMTSATLLLMLLGRRVSMAQRLVATDALGRLTPRKLSDLVRRIVLTTLAIEAAGAVVLVAALAVTDSELSAHNVWRGVFTAVSAFNNAGFDLEGDFRSLTEFSGNPPILLLIGVLTVIGGTGYAVWVDIFGQRTWRRLTIDTKIVLLASALLWVVGASVIMFELLRPAGSADIGIGTAAANATALSVFARTSGFTSIDLGLAQDALLFFLAGLMFIGGASASTAGGIKLTTFSILGFAIVSSLRGDDHVTAFEREIPWRHVNRALALALLSVALVFATTFVLALLNEESFVALLFEAVSAFANCGLGTGITSRLDVASDLLLVVVMYAGRLGPLTVALALARHAGGGERFRYAEEQVSIG